MIRLALSESERAKLRFLPVRDHYDKDRWVAAVKQGVAPRASGGGVLLVGHHKDATSAYLHDFPGWTLDDVGRQGEVHASALLNGSLNGALAAMVDQAPASSLQFLRAWAALPYYANLAREWDSLRQEKAKWHSAPYAPVFVTVDAVVQCGREVLLIRRGRHPGLGLYAIPGSFLEQRETVYQSALRELGDETGLHLLPDDMRHALKAVRVFDHPDRSQRGRVITHAHYFDLGARRAPEPVAGDDASSAEWVPIEKLGAMEDQFHDDHFHILDFFLSLSTA